MFQLPSSFSKLVTFGTVFHLLLLQLHLLRSCRRHLKAIPTSVIRFRFSYFGAPLPLRLPVAYTVLVDRVTLAYSLFPIFFQSFLSLLFFTFCLFSAFLLADGESVGDTPTGTIQFNGLCELSMLLTFVSFQHSERLSMLP